MTNHIDKLEDAARGAQQAWEFRTAELRNVERERDEARAELRRFIDEGGHTAWDVVAERNDEITALKATVERLRAAQPDHSRFRVWRTPRGIEVQEGNGFMMLWSGTNASKLADPTAIRAGADRERDRAHAVATFLDAEAAGAGATTDDEVDAARDELGEAYCEAIGITDEHLRTVIRAVDAHRARNGQDGAR